MKFTSLFSIILLVHLALLGVLFVQPGCQSTTSRPPVPAAAAPEVSATESGQPARPTTARRDLDPAFNAGLAEPAPVQTSRSDRLQPPSRPSSPAPVVDVAQRDRQLPQDILQPVLPSLPDSAGEVYVVRPGDTATGIAQRKGVTLDALLRANQLDRSSVIYVGQELTIPGGTVAATAAASAAPPPGNGGTVYTVRSGDTLSGIATRHGVTVAQLRAVNALSGDLIRVGQALVIPEFADGQREPAVRTQQPAPAGTAASTESYTVQSGDTPTHIARRFGVEVNELLRVNGISDPRRLKVGQVLQIPGRESVTPSTPTRSEADTETPRTQERQPATPVLRDATDRPRELPSSPPQPSIMDLEALDDEDIPYSEVERVEDGG